MIDYVRPVMIDYVKHVADWKRNMRKLTKEELIEKLRLAEKALECEIGMRRYKKIVKPSPAVFI
jgi:hypothetical protein